MATKGRSHGLYICPGGQRQAEKVPHYSQGHAARQAIFPYCIQRLDIYYCQLKDHNCLDTQDGCCTLCVSHRLRIRTELNDNAITAPTGSG